MDGCSLKRCPKNYLGLQHLFKTRIAKYKNEVRIFDGKDIISDYWKALLGPYYEFEENNKREIVPGYNLIFKDVTLTNWISLTPGLFYTKNMWEKGPKEVRKALRDVRLPEQNGKRIVSIHKVREFVAHGDISRGIPIIIDSKLYDMLEIYLSRYGAVEVAEISTILSPILQDAESNFLFPEGMPRMIPVAEGIPSMSIKHSEPRPTNPLLCTAWTICAPVLHDKIVPQNEKSFWYTFWIGSDDFERTIIDATNKIKNIARSKNCIPLWDFDADITRFDTARYGPKDINKLKISREDL